MEDTTSQHSTSFALTQETTAPVKRCPKCQSVFMTQTHCESCGVQFELDRVQGPLGERSYFGIKERAIEKAKIFGFYFSWLEESQKSGLRSEYFYRYRALVELLCLSEDDFREAETRKLYLLELGLIVEELTWLSDQEEKTIQDLLMPLQGPKTQVLSQLIQKTFEKALAAKDHFHAHSFLERKIFGSLRWVSVVRVLAIGIFIVLCALGAYRYLTLVS